ncbi:MAG: WG repeat-containing protein [Bacteroidetes bacterium]|nr:WG repeat-containing protein [Bacteroidota bacterium]
MEQNSKFCPKCGHSNLFDAVFCMSCGNKFPEIPAPIVNPPAAESPVEVEKQDSRVLQVNQETAEFKNPTVLGQPVMNQAAKPQQPQANGDDKNHKSKTTPKRKGRVWMKVTFGLLFLVLFSAVAFGYFFIRNNSGSITQLDGVTHIPFKEHKEDRWGLISLDGKVVVTNEWIEQPSPVVAGYTRVKNSKGKFEYYKIEPKPVQVGDAFKSTSPHSEGLAAVVPENGPVAYVDENIKIVFEVKTLEGKEVEEAGNFKDGLARFRNSEGKYGFIDKSGAVVISAIYDRAEPFSDGLALVSKRSKNTNEFENGFINRKGSVVIKLQSGVEYKSSSEGYIAYSDDKEHKQWGFINQEGEKVIKARDKYTFVGPFVDGYCTFSDGSLQGIMNKKGEEVIRPKYKFALYFNGLVLINDASSEESDSKYGYVNLDGSEVIRPQYDKAFPFIDKCAFVKENERYDVIDSKGKSLSKTNIEELGYDNTVFHWLVVQTENQYASSYWLDDHIQISDYFQAEAIVNSICSSVQGTGINGIEKSTSPAALYNIIKDLIQKQNKDQDTSAKAMGEFKAETKVPDNYPLFSYSSQISLDNLKYNKYTNGRIELKYSDDLKVPRKEMKVVQVPGYERDDYGDLVQVMRSERTETVVGWELNTAEKSHLEKLAYVFEFSGKASEKVKDIYQLLIRKTENAGFVLQNSPGTAIQDEDTRSFKHPSAAGIQLSLRRSRIIIYYDIDFASI